MIGFADFGDVNLNYAALQETNAIASHVLVFLLRSVVNPLKFSLANFATKKAIASQIFSFSWKAVANCKTFKTLNFISLFYEWALTVSELQSHHEEKIYFLSQSPQLLVLIRSTLERWKAKSTSEPSRYFEPGTPRLVIQYPNH